MLQSQWDFDATPEPDPASAPVAEKVWTVSEITRRLKRLFEQEVGRISVLGEITNLRRQASGHIYFTLKDDQSAIQCVLFRGTAGANRSCLKDGAEIRAKGELSIYAPRGQYQLVVREVEPQGEGALRARFEAMKKRLQDLGWFDSERKKPIPRFPSRIGCVTSETGAALRDFVHVIERRFAGVEIWVKPSRVQGEGAAEQVAQGIRDLQSFRDENGNGVDVIVITRGGGSLEDLWAFNEEVVAQAIFESRIPVISAVGHEIDFSISDFVADLRAATPSAAAELLTEHFVQAVDKAIQLEGRFDRQVAQRMHWIENHLNNTARRLDRCSPSRWLDMQRQKLDDLDLDLDRGVQRLLNEKTTRVSEFCGRLKRIHPEKLALQAREKLEQRSETLQQLIRRQLEMLSGNLKSLADQLKILSPLNTLDRGYSITFNSKTGQVIKDIHDVAPGDLLSTRLNQGEIISKVLREEEAIQN